MTNKVFESVAIDKLVFPEKNVRVHTTTQIKEFKRSVEMFGQFRPIVVDEDYTILAGNGLYMALKESNFEEVDIVRYTSLTKAQKVKLMIADNKIYDLGQTRQENVIDLLEGLEEDFDVPGFDENTLKMMLGSVDELQENLSQYGVIDEESRERLKKNEESKEKEAEKVAQDIGAEYVPPTRSRAFDKSSDDEYETKEDKIKRDNESKGKMHVTCTNCGEKIWL